METQILKLNEPYEYIYCNGSIGLHIATMIVYEAKTNEDGDYELETHSHPIVKYRLQPGGTVWNRAELRDCRVLCREDNKRITMQEFYDFVSGVGRMCLADDEGNEVNMPNSLDAPMWKGVLNNLGIEIEWPIEHIEGKDAPQDVFYIDLVFEQNPEGSKYKYTCYDYGESDVVFTGGAMLYFSARFNDIDQLKQELQNCMQSYYAAFSDHKFKIVFGSMCSSEFDEAIEWVNSKEAVLRKEVDEVDV